MVFYRKKAMAGNIGVDLITLESEKSGRAVHGV